MIKQGFYWHVHHNSLIEWCWDYNERVNAINKDKPKNEIPIRLANERHNAGIKRGGEIK